MIRLLFFLVIAGVLIYGLVWLIQRGRAASDDRRPVAPPPPPPDDDPVFLAQLDRRLREQRRQREAEAARRAAESGESPGTAPTHGDVTPAPDTIESITDAEDDPERRGD